MSGDVNAILRAYLVAQPGLAFLGGRLYCPRLPEKAALPAIGFFVRGGGSNPHIPPLVEPSFQFDCWAGDPVEARRAYRALYDALQGLQNRSVTVGTTVYQIAAVEESQGQDVQDVDFPGYYEVRTFFKVIVEG